MSISFQDVTVKFEQATGVVDVVNGLDMSIETGEFSVLVGPSGCGKSTLLRLVSGLATPTNGHVYVGDERVTSPNRNRGMMFQAYTLYPWLTVIENVRFPLDLRRMPRLEATETAQELLEVTQLSDFADSYPHQLSGGMQQRVALARVLANDPDTLLMDEPFGALDSQTRTQMQSFLLDVWQGSGKTVLFVTHDIDEAVFLGDRVHIMGKRPQGIVETIDIEIERPRSMRDLVSSEFANYRRAAFDLLHGIGDTVATPRP